MHVAAIDFLGDSHAFMTTAYSWSAFSLTTVLAMLHHPTLFHLFPSLNRFYLFNRKSNFMIRYICVYDDKDFKTRPLLIIFQVFLKIQILKHGETRWYTLEHDAPE
jgi:hypothetical protein